MHVNMAALDFDCCVVSARGPDGPCFSVPDGFPKIFQFLKIRAKFFQKMFFWCF